MTPLIPASTVREAHVPRSLTSRPTIAGYGADMATRPSGLHPFAAPDHAVSAHPSIRSLAMQLLQEDLARAHCRQRLQEAADQRRSGRLRTALSAQRKAHAAQRRAEASARRARRLMAIAAIR
jgi:hypothetical protein